MSKVVRVRLKSDVVITFNSKDLRVDAGDLAELVLNVEEKLNKEAHLLIGDTKVFVRHHFGGDTIVVERW